MKHEAVRKLAESEVSHVGTAELARELSKEVTRVLGQLVPATPAAPRVRDERQDALWDCASVLQSAATVAPTQRLLEQLRELLPLLEQAEQSDFHDRLTRWVAESWDIVRTAG